MKYRIIWQYDDDEPHGIWGVIEAESVEDAVWDFKDKNDLFGESGHAVEVIQCNR